MDPVTRRHFVLRASALSTSALLPTRLWAAAGGKKIKVDVCVYGGTSGGVIAAVTLARLGRSVALVEPLKHLGGMTSGGLGWIDVKLGGPAAYASITGEYYARIRKHYGDSGVDVMKVGNHGAVAEPHVAEAALEEMLAPHTGKITILREHRLASVRKDGRRLRSVVLDHAPVDPRGAPAPRPLEPSAAEVTAAMFLDCSYEGDLLAAAGVSHRMDRESAAEFGESAAGVKPNGKTEFGASFPVIDPYKRPGDPSSGLIPLVSSAPVGATGTQSNIVQAFNFRMCLVRENFIPIAPGSDYRPEHFELVARMLAAQKVAGTPILPEQMHGPRAQRLLKFSPLPNGKTDINNAGNVSMDYVTGGAERYATASWAERAKMWHAHEDYQRGFLYFLQTDPRVDEALREDLKLWGLPRDEFRDTRGWPTQLYVREARRMTGAYVMRQSDCEHAPAAMEESVGIGTYSLDSHVCQRLVQDGSAIAEGGFLLEIPKPYPIPYRALVPKPQECENLLVTFCVSSTHVCFASVRMEPPFMVLSESAARAAHLALEANTSVQAIPIDKLAKSLREVVGQIVLPEQVPKA